MTEKVWQDEAPDERREPTDQVVVIGGGPAGLSAAYELTKLGLRPVVIEKGNQVGGIARTENFQGYYFDMGGHRFYTKSKEVNDMWREVLGPDFLKRPRLSRIYYGKRFFYYPLRPFNALAALGPLYGILSLFSYIKWQFFPYPEENTFEQWVTNRFGRRLFLTFFKTYTEKVWGIPTNELSAEWAAQRIKNLSLGNAIISMFVKPQGKITSLIEEFDYPRRGPGMMWKAVQACVEARGGQVILEAEVVHVHRSDDRITGVVIRRADGSEELIEGTHFVSSMAVKEFIQRVDEPPPAVLEAVEQLSYRAFLTVCLIVDQPDLFPDNWIYIHDPEVKVGRIQNFKNWSPDMVPDASKSSLGLEYFCNQDDEFWNMPDAELIELGKHELEVMGLARASDVSGGAVYRVEKAYPVYDSTYREHLGLARGFIETLNNFATIGRNGLHRYNNQDHAMLTGMYAVRNLFCGEQNDLWRVNAEDEYQEEIKDKTTEIVREALGWGLPKLDPVAYGAACGLAGSLLMFLAAFLIYAQGTPAAWPSVGLLSQFFPYYDATLPGSLLGLGYGFLIGFVLGWLFASVRNVSVLFSMAAIEHSAKMRLFWKVLY